MITESQRQNQIMNGIGYLTLAVMNFVFLFIVSISFENIYGLAFLLPTFIFFMLGILSLVKDTAKQDANCVEDVVEDNE